MHVHHTAYIPYESISKIFCQSGIVNAYFIIAYRLLKLKYYVVYAYRINLHFVLQFRQ